MRIDTKYVSGSAFVIGVLLLLLIWLGSEARSETVFEIGPSFVSYENTEALTVVLQERFGEGKYAVGLGYVDDQKLDTCGRPDCQWNVGSQLFVGVERLVTPSFGNFLDNVTIGVGAYWFQSKSRISTANLNVRLTVEVDITDRIFVVLSHFSNGGTGEVVKLTNENFLVPVSCECPAGAICKPCPERSTRTSIVRSCR
jgi:hypothetical protein